MRILHTRWLTVRLLSALKTVLYSWKHDWNGLVYDPFLYNLSVQSSQFLNIEITCVPCYYMIHYTSFVKFLHNTVFYSDLQSIKAFFFFRVSTHYIEKEQISSTATNNTIHYFLLQLRVDANSFTRSHKTTHLL